MDISYKNICRITFPVLFSLLVEQIIGITDTAFLGHVGEVELGASAIAGVCYLIMFVTGSGFGMGLQVLIARLNGEKNKEEITAIFSTGLYFLIFMAFVIILSSRFALPSLLHHIIKSEDIYSAAIAYLDWRIYGLVFSFIIIAFRSYYVGITRTKILSVCSVVMVSVNIVCNYILVFGKYGFPELGIRGAAIGSTIAEFSAVLLFLIHYRVTGNGRLFEPVSFVRKQWNELKRILNLSMWTMLQSFLSLASWLVFFIIIEHIGERALSISNIVRSISAVPFMLVQSFAYTGSSLVGNLIGEGKGDMVMKLCWKIIKVCYLFCIPLLIAGFIFPGLLIKIYTDNVILEQESVLPLYVMLSAVVMSVPASVYYCAISGTGNTFVTLEIGLAALVVYVVYIEILAWLAPDVSLLWTSEHIYAVVLFIFSVIYMLSGKWKHKKI